MKKIIIAVLIAVYICNSAFAGVKVVDGDSLEIDGKRIRLEGIDAPEYMQKCFDKYNKEYDCGFIAYKKLRAMVSDDIKCQILNKDRYKRYLAICYAGNVNINAQMVANGWAVAYTRYDDRFIEQQKQAQSKGKGIWQGRFMLPELYRALMRDK